MAKKAKRSVGRPPVPKREKRRGRAVAFSDAEFETVQEAADVDGASAAVFIRSAAMDRAKRVLSKRKDNTASQ